MLAATLLLFLVISPRLSKIHLSSHSAEKVVLGTETLTKGVCKAGQDPRGV